MHVNQREREREREHPFLFPLPQILLKTPPTPSRNKPRKWRPLFQTSAISLNRLMVDLVAAAAGVLFIHNPPKYVSHVVLLVWG